MAAPGTLGPCLRRADSGAFLLNPTGGAQWGPTRGHSLEDRPPLTARRRPPRPLPSPRPLPKPRPLARPRGERRERAAARPLPFLVRRTVHLPRPGFDSSPPWYAPDFPLAAAGPRPAASHLAPGQFPRVTALARPRNGRARAPRRCACAAPCRPAPPFGCEQCARPAGGAEPRCRVPILGT